MTQESAMASRHCVMDVTSRGWSMSNCKGRTALLTSSLKECDMAPPRITKAVINEN